MSLDPSKIIASAPRTVEIVGIGPVVVRRATLADISLANDLPYWWTRLFTLPDGSPLFAGPELVITVLERNEPSTLKTPACNPCTPPPSLPVEIDAIPPTRLSN